MGVVGSGMVWMAVEKAGVGWGWSRAIVGMGWDGWKRYGKDVEWGVWDGSGAGRCGWVMGRNGSVKLCGIKVGVNWDREVG